MWVSWSWGCGFGCFTVHGPPLIDWMVDGMCVGFVAMRTDDDDDDHGSEMMRGVGPFRPSIPPSVCLVVGRSVCGVGRPDYNSYGLTLGLHGCAHRLCG